MSFSSEVLSIETNSGVGTLWLDRPEKRNAMNPPMWKDLPGALSALATDGETRAIILAGKGKSFSVGLDLVVMGAGVYDGDGNRGERAPRRARNKIRSGPKRRSDDRTESALEWHLDDDHDA
jgi:enoyl-CoA hydratase/carnithine racemase